MKDTLQKILNVIEYGSKCLAAISKGIRSVVDDWPTWNPTTNPGPAPGKKKENIDIDVPAEVVH